jgi:hypothetical protein
LELKAISIPPGNAAIDRPGADWLSTLKEVPGIDILLEAVKSWWEQHPMRNAVLLASDAAKAALEPLAQRYPLGLVGVSLIVGVLFAWRRPWRWLLTPALFAGLLPQLLSKTMGSLPPKTWLTILASLSAQPRKSNQP